MKPRANLGNRTRQPKGCANRIAKPVRLGRTSQNHLMMIILNKTGATTVAQLKATGIQQCNNAKTALFQRFLDTVTAIQNLLPAAFGVSTREPAALFLDAWQSGLLHHLAKVATGNGPGVRLPQHPRAVAGGKKPFLPLDFLMAVWVR